MSLARCSREEAVAFGREVGLVRTGFDGFLDAATGAGARLWLASGGFDFYIEAILGERLGRFEHAFFNRTRFVGDTIELEFHQGLGCDRCAVCKGRVCERARAEGARVIFIGDGASDRCAIGKADLLCAVEGSMLARGCQERAVEHRSFADFAELAAIFR
jgi:2-hydroxy-3-keto-5-methylthiopentenyl-1-phosphate phosphatase